MEPKLNPQPDTNLCNPLDDYKPMPKMQTEIKLIYCDYVAAIIKEQLSKQTGMGVGKINSDLDPKEGFLISHKKVIELHYMGLDYKITVEAV
jgi:hypothetical protein